jgi:two pore calcium channel protein, plant
MRLYVQIGLYIVGWLDTLLCLLRHTSPWVINFLRPPIVMLNLTQPR